MLILKTRVWFDVLYLTEKQTNKDYVFVFHYSDFNDISFIYSSKPFYFFTFLLLKTHF